MKRKFSRLLSENGVVGGIGVLLVFLGFWAHSTAAKIFCFMTAAVAFYFVAQSFRARRNTTSREGKDEDQAEPLTKKKILVFDDLGSSEKIVEDEPSREGHSPAMVEGTEHGGGSGEEWPFKHEVVHRLPPVKEEGPITLDVSFFVDPEFSSINGLKYPETEFHYLLKNVLSVIKETLFVHTAAFFWINRSTKKIILESSVSELIAEGGFSREKRFLIGSDMVSQVALSGEPQVISQIAPEAEHDAVPYYSSPQHIRSFIGVPVFYPDASGSAGVHSRGDVQSQRDLQPVAVLAADSKMEDVFGKETLVLFAHYSKLLASLLKSHTEKYDLLSDVALLKADKHVWSKVLENADVSVVINTLVDEVSGLLSWDALAVTLFDEHQHQWAIASVRTRRSDKYVVAKQAVDFNASIVADAIRTNAVQNIADLSTAGEVRFFAGERAMGIPQHGSFFAVPISSGSKCFGVLSAEKREANGFAKTDAAVIQHLASIAATALEVHEANDLLRDLTTMDEMTGALTKKFLIERLQEEVHRADDFGLDLSFVLVSLSQISDITVRYGKQGADNAVRRVAAILRSSVRSYDLVGRYDAASFGIVLISTAANDAYLWAEKIRSAIASTVITSDQKTFSVTITGGICGVSDGMKFEECVSKTEQVLRKAVESGGNTVRVF
ncbi:MAG: diguanylate cyclase [Bacteroidota bacterium]|nr:diguanylate cyclase [Bacteroidota bacterium]